LVEDDLEVARGIADRALALATAAADRPCAFRVVEHSPEEARELDDLLNA
jgi:hypothetical protein